MLRPPVTPRTPRSRRSNNDYVRERRRRPSTPPPPPTAAAPPNEESSCPTPRAAPAWACDWAPNLRGALNPVALKSCVDRVGPRRGCRGPCPLRFGPIESPNGGTRTADSPKRFSLVSIPPHPKHSQSTLPITPLRPQPTPQATAARRIHGPAKVSSSCTHAPTAGWGGSAERRRARLNAHRAPRHRRPPSSRLPEPHAAAKSGAAADRGRRSERVGRETQALRSH